MSNLRKLSTIMTILVVFQLSCTKLEQKPAKEGALPTISLNQTNSIPSDWGKLVSTTVSPDSPGLVLLWFQDEKGDIHLASYDMRQNKLSPDAAVIRRY